MRKRSLCVMILILISFLGFDVNMHVDYLNSFIGGHSSGAHIPVAQFSVNTFIYVTK